MKRSLRILSFICLGLVMLGGLQAAKRLPADSGGYVEKKYAGWSGVLRGWVCSEWRCSGNFNGWLNRCAADFEKTHDGVYIEFETVSAAVMVAQDLYPPDMLVFSGGMVEMDAEAIAMGGYIFAENPDGTGTAIPEKYAAAYIAMDAEQQAEVPESGMDLGLPAMANAVPVEIAEDAFRRFMNGELRRTIVNQEELSRLIGLRESGRGPDWVLIPKGEYCWQDQVLYMGIQTEGERERLCREFLALLLEDGHQAMLADIGAFPTTGISAFDGLSPYYVMEQQILLTRALFPKGEHSAADFGTLVRKLSTGQISRQAAQHILLQTCS